MNVKEQLLESMEIPKDQWPLYDDTESENGQPTIPDVPSIPPMGIPEPENPLAAANIPESWWPNCYITDNGQIFTPRFDRDGTMTATGEQAYREWLAACDAPPLPPEPTPEEIQDAAIILNQARQDAAILQLEQTNAMLLLQLAQVQAGGENNV